MPGRAERQGLRRAHEPARRALHAPGLHGQRVRPRRARLRPARLRQRRGAVRPEGPPRRPRLARPVRRLQRQHRRGRHRPQHRRRSGPRPTRSRSSGCTGPARSTPRTTSTRSRSSTCAAPIPAPSTTSTAPTRCGLGSSGTSARPRTRSCGEDQAPLIGDPSYADDAVFAVDRWLARVHADHRRVALPRKIIQDKPDTVAPPLHRRKRQGRALRACATRPCRPTARRAREADGPLSEDVMKCRLKPHAPRRLPGHLHRRPVGAAPAGVPGRCLRLHEARRRASTAPCRGSPTRRGAGA